jgi:hypothetical protein
MKKSFGIIAILVLGTTHICAREWGFLKDTVYESRSSNTGGWPQKDTVFLKNIGVDSLRFDSVGVEPLTSGKNQVDIFFYKSASISSPAYELFYSGGRTQYLYTSAKSISVGALDSLHLLNFRIDWQVYASPESITAGSDTISARLVFFASNGRGRDTVIVLGIEENKPVSLRTQLHPTVGFKAEKSSFDLRGRRIEPVSDGLKAPLTPVVLPKN